MKRTPISSTQRRRARKLLDTAETALRQLCEERLNLDHLTREAAERAIDKILSSHAALSEQPESQH